MIPDQLTSDYPTFIKLKPRSKDPSHGSDSSSGPFYHASDSELVTHIEERGNVARVLRDDLLAFDVDDKRLADRLQEVLGKTFIIKSGGSGYSEHWYYRCPSWDGRKQFSEGGVDIGSLRSGSWYCVAPPSIHPETRDGYQVKSDRPIRDITVAELSEVLKGLGAANTGGGGAPAAAAGRVGGSPPAIPDDYPNREATWQTLRTWLKSNDLLDRLSQTTSDDWSGDEFVVAKCLAEGGFHETAIRDALSRFHHSAKWHRRGDRYRNQTVRKAIQAAADDPHVEFSSTGDMAPPRAESRKTESGGTSPGYHGGENMATYTDKEEVTVLEGEDDGDSFKKVVRVVREENGETVDYVSIKRGRIEEVELRSGEVGLTERVTDSTSIGSPEYIGELAEALLELDEKLNGAE